jgi:hypothetical protein
MIIKFVGLYIFLVILNQHKTQRFLIPFYTISPQSLLSLSQNFRIRVAEQNLMFSLVARMWAEQNFMFSLVARMWAKQNFMFSLVARMWAEQNFMFSLVARMWAEQNFMFSLVARMWA